MRLASVITCSVLSACTTEALDPPTGPIERYVISAQQLPKTNVGAREHGLDLNGDKTPDNQLGMIMPLLADRGMSPATGAEALIDRGDILMLVQLQRAEPGADDTLAFSLYEGANPSITPCADELDAVCRRHLQGDAQFDVVETTDPLVSPNAERPVIGPGSLTVAFGFFGEPVQLELLGARARILEATGTTMRGTIGGAITRADIENKLVPPFQRALEQLVAAQCTLVGPPACGCATTTDEYDARYWLGSFDVAPKDCVITAEEIVKSSIVISLTSPDVAIDGEHLLSFGFGFEAVAAAFEP